MGSRPALGREDVQPSRGPAQRLVLAPEARVAEARGRQQMDVDGPDARSVQLVAVDEIEQFGMPRAGRLGQGLQELQDLVAMLEIAAGQFFDDQRVREDRAFQEERGQVLLPPPEMVHPDRGVDEDHAPERRRMLFSFGWLPASAARRSRTFFSIKASSPA